MLKKLFQIMIPVLMVASVCKSHYVQWQYSEIPRPPQILSPCQIMVDVTNDLTYRILYHHLTTSRNNFAFSPTALGSVLIALYEGSDGRSCSEIHQVLHLPWNRDIIRIGYRDIHRRLRTYLFSQENPLAGLSLNRENVCITLEYEIILKFYGYDLGTDMISLKNKTCSGMPSPITTTTRKPQTTTTTESTKTTEIITIETTTTESSTSTTAITTEMSTTEAATTDTPTTETLTTEISTTEPPTTTESPTTDTSTIETTTTETSTTEPPTTTELSTTDTSTMETTTAETSTTEPPTTETSTMETTTETSTTEIPTTKCCKNTTETTTEAPTTDASTMETSTTESTNAGTTEEATTEMETTTSPIGSSPPPIPILAGLESNVDRRKRSIPLPYYKTEAYNIPFAPEPQVIPDITLFNFDQIYITPRQMTNNQVIHHIFYLSALETIQTTYKVYNSILNYNYIPQIKSTALELELDSTEYSLMLLVPNYNFDLEYLVASLKLAPPLRQIKRSLRPRWVQAIIPDFEMRGCIFLTNDLQNMGVREVFEPYRADFSPMTEDNGIYVKHIQQLIDVHIKTRPIDQLKRHIGPVNRPIEISVNHPFLFFIMDKELDVAVMAGAVRNPLNVRIQ